MEWLRCNKCYREMKKSKRPFSLTQCGHLFCDKCMAEVSTKCPECGSQNFTTMPLSYPPKLETTLNYFAPVDEFMGVCAKSEEFQSNQMAITLRGFEEIEQKYEDMKKSYYKEMSEMNDIAQAFQKLRMETMELESVRDCLLKSKAENARVAQGATRFSVHAHERQSHDIQRHFSMSKGPGKTQDSGLPRQYKDQRVAANLPTTDSYSMKSELRTPKHTYDPRASFSSGVLTSDAYTINTGFSSIPESVNSREGDFRVPIGQKVPKSAASLNRRARTMQKLTEPKHGFHS